MPLKGLKRFKTFTGAPGTHFQPRPERSRRVIAHTACLLYARDRFAFSNVSSAFRRGVDKNRAPCTNFDQCLDDFRARSKSTHPGIFSTSGLVDFAPGHFRGNRRPPGEPRRSHIKTRTQHIYIYTYIRICVYVYMRS